MEQHPKIILVTPNELAVLIDISVRKALGEQSPKSSYIDDKPMNINEAAAFLQMPKSSIYQLTSTRKIPFSKVQKALIFFRKDLLDWLESGKKKTQKEIEAEGFSKKGSVRK
jgi:predicted DNA-binding transcriptional regulator AlpA